MPKSHVHAACSRQPTSHVVQSQSREQSGTPFVFSWRQPLDASCLNLQSCLMLSPALSRSWWAGKRDNREGCRRVCSKPHWAPGKRGVQTSCWQRQDNVARRRGVKGLRHRGTSEHTNLTTRHLRSHQATKPGKGTRFKQLRLSLSFVNGTLPKVGHPNCHLNVLFSDVFTCFFAASGNCQKFKPSDAHLTSRHGAGVTLHRLCSNLSSGVLASDSSCRRSPQNTLLVALTKCSRTRT